MDNMSKDNHINLVEFPAGSPKELKATKEFFTDVFGWKFKEWGEEYVDTQDSGLPSGIIATKQGRPDMPLVVVYAKNLEVAKEKIIKAGGTITQDTYPFPGGKRFHFKDPAGNELAAWSE